jgi:hypothetical protein
MESRNIDSNQLQRILRYSRKYQSFILKPANKCNDLLVEKREEEGESPLQNMDLCDCCVNTTSGGLSNDGQRLYSCIVI